MKINFNFEHYYLVTTFYLDLEKKQYVPKEQEKNINRNPDWVCKYCNQLNSDNEKVCVSCGASRTGENLNYFENRNKKIDEEKEKSLQDEINNQESKQYVSNLSFTLKNFIFSKIGVILIALAIILGISGIVYLFIPKVHELTITEMSWQRSIDMIDIKL